MSKVSHHVLLNCIPCDSARWLDIVSHVTEFVLAKTHRKFHRNFSSDKTGSVILMLILIVCPATCSFMFYSHCIVMVLRRTSCIKLPFLFILLWCHFTCNDAHEPLPPPCTAHMYDHWFEWQPYLYKQISFIWFVGLQWTWLQLCLLLITLQNSGLNGILECKYSCT